MTLTRKNYFKRLSTLASILFIGGMVNLRADTSSQSQNGSNIAEVPIENEKSIPKVFQSSSRRTSGEADGAYKRYVTKPNPEVQQRGTLKGEEYMPGTVVKEIYDEKLDLHQYVLSNNVRVNLKSIPYEENTIGVRANFGRGELEAPNQKAAIPFVTKRFLANGGLQADTSEGMKQAFSDNMSYLDFIVGNDEFSFTATRNRKHLQAMLSLMCAYFTAPIYQKEVMNKLDMDLDRIYRSLHKTIQGVRKDKVARLLASGDWKFGYPPENEAKAVKLEEIRSFLEKPLKNSYLEISIVGDFDVQECLKIVLETVGMLPERENSRPDLDDLRQVKFPKIPLQKTFFVEDEQYPTAFVMVVWPTDDGRNPSLTKRLEVLAEIFSYRLSGYLEPSIKPYTPVISYPSLAYKQYGYFKVSSQVAPTQVDELQKAFLEVANNIQAGITEDEYEQAIKTILSDINLQQRQIRYWLNAIDGSQEFPTFLSLITSSKKAYTHMLKEDVQTTAEQYLNPQKAVVIKILPLTAS